MLLNEAIKMLEAKLSETKGLIEKAENGNKLLIKTSITFMDASFDEKDEFILGKSTAVLANLIIRDAEHIGDEDPEFYYTIATNIKGDEIADMSKLEKEYLEFDSRVLEFIEKLEKSTDTSALVAEEYAQIEEEGRKAMANLEASLRALKKRGIIAAAAIIGILVLLVTLKSILG